MTEHSPEEARQVRMTWGRRCIEDARQEFATIARQIRYSRLYREWWLRRFVWRVEFALLAWAEKAEPSDAREFPRLLAEDDNGDWLMPRGYRDGEPYWKGWWRWWMPTHWPAYIRTRRAGTYVMVERCEDR